MLATTTNLEGLPAADFKNALALFHNMTHTEAAKKHPGLQQLFYSPPRSDSGQERYEKSIKNGGTLYAPEVFVRVYDGRINEIQAYEAGL